jgi:S1-C subfamily serine protease
MQMEELNKTQIVLLTLLVSFVTSIATGITTVTLMDQAPPAVTQTVNRIVERTVEKVVPEVITRTIVGENQVKTERIIVNEDDLIVESIEKVTANLVRVGVVNKFGNGEFTLEGMGYLNPGSTVLTSNSIILDNAIYDVEVAEDKYIKVQASSQNEKKGTALLKAVDEKESSELKGNEIVFAKEMKLGQRIFTVGGFDRNSVLIGLISSMVTDENDEIVSINSTLHIDKEYIGSPVFNASGEIVGLVSDRGDKITIVPLNSLPIL